MEALDKAERSPGLLREIESVLRLHVWSRAVTKYMRDDLWRMQLADRLGADFVDDWVWGGVRLCATHGDCTADNALRRGSGELVIGDPLPPRPYVMRCAEVDMGRILQSALGWETMIHGEEPIEWEEPEFWGEKMTRRRALFWCAVTAMRIQLDWQTRCPERLSAEIAAWLRETKERCLAASV